MKITVVGAVLIALATIAAVLLIRALTQKGVNRSHLKQPHNGTEA